MAAKHIVLIFGYGPHLAPVKIYLDEIVEFLNFKKPDVVIFSGSFTAELTARGISEAAMMRDYILPQLTYAPTVYLDEKSFTTPDNAENCAKKIFAMQLMNVLTELTICCHESRKWTVKILGRRFLKRWPEVKTVSWKMGSLPENVVAFLFTCAGIVFPGFARWFHVSRMHRALRI